jgi:hypothetical protein
VSLGRFQNCNLLKMENFRRHGVEDEFDKDSNEVLRVMFVPASVRAGGVELAKTTGWTFDPTLGVLRVRHAGSNEVEILGARK